MKFLGEEIGFWSAITLALLVKFMLSPYENLKRSAGGILAGFLCAYYGASPVIRWVDGLTMDDKALVAIALAFTGEHLTRWLMLFTPDKALDLWRGKSRK